MATLVLVHGAWHGGWAWARTERALIARGHRVITPTLTGLGDRAHLLARDTCLQTHVSDLIATLELLDTEEPGAPADGTPRPVVLVAHSYSGQVVASAASARPDLIDALIYVDAFIPEDGEPGIDQLPVPVADHYRDVTDREGFGWLLPPRKLKALGLTDPADIAWLTPHLTPHPLRGFTDPATVTPESLAIPSSYIECTAWDRAFRASAQRARERGWPVYELDSNHEAMISAPAELADLLIAALPTGADGE